MSVPRHHHFTPSKLGPWKLLEYKGYCSFILYLPHAKSFPFSVQGLCSDMSSYMQLSFSWASSYSKFHSCFPSLFPSLPSAFLFVNDFFLFLFLWCNCFAVCEAWVSVSVVPRGGRVRSRLQGKWVVMAQGVWSCRCLGSTWRSQESGHIRCMLLYKLNIYTCASSVEKMLFAF